jgi:hypothetical protein
VLKSENGTAQNGNPCWHIASYNTTWTITNLGIFYKANLTKSKSSGTAVGFNQWY